MFEVRQRVRTYFLTDAKLKTVRWWQAPCGLTPPERARDQTAGGLDAVPASVQDVGVDRGAPVSLTGTPRAARYSLHWATVYSR